MTLSALLIEMDPEILLKRERRYVLVSFLVFLFGAVYERFSHDVYSGFMMYAFAIPLAGGFLPCLLLSLTGSRSGKKHPSCPPDGRNAAVQQPSSSIPVQKKMPGKLLFDLYNCGLAAWTVGSLMEGVLEIYGTTNRLILVYWIAGTGFVAAAGILLFIAIYLQRKARFSFEDDLKTRRRPK